MINTGLRVYEILHSMNAGDVLKTASLGGAAVLLVVDPQGLALAGVLCTSLAGLIAQVLKNRDDAAREERRHRFAIEDAAATAAVRASIDERIRQNVYRIEENTALTKQVQVLAQAALDANDKK